MKKFSTGYGSWLKESRDKGHDKQFDVPLLDQPVSTSVDSVLRPELCSRAARNMILSNI